jgi:hypothetical protein
MSDELNYITILDLALSRGAKEVDGRISGDEFNRLGLPIMGGCEYCGATIGAYNAYPSKSGYLRCSDCIGSDGFETTQEYEEWEKPKCQTCADTERLINELGGISELENYTYVCNECGKEHIKERK